MTPPNVVPFSVPVETSEQFEDLRGLVQALAAVDSCEDLRHAIDGGLGGQFRADDIAVVRCIDGRFEVVVGPADAAQRPNRYSWSTLTTGGVTMGMLGLRDRAQFRGARHADCVAMLLTMTVQNVLTIETLRRNAVIDGLTGCFNRSHALNVLEAELRRATRTDFPVSIMIIDIDAFKTINDRYGHMPGDAVLAAAAEQLKAMLRQSDVRCRMGGDEFLVILPDTSLEDAVGVAEAVREALAAVVLRSPRGAIRISASIGVAADLGSAAAEAFIDRADVALYRAKQAGRNTVQACLSSSVRVRHASLHRSSARPA